MSSSNPRGLPLLRPVRSSSRLRWAALAALAAGWAAGAAAMAADPRPTLCAAGEAAVFACPVGGGRLVSLCASADLGEHAGTLTYRFGRPGRLELSFPETPAHPKAHFRRGSIASAGGGGDFVSFSRDAHTYTLWADTGPGGEHAGVAVLKDGQTVANLPCRGPALNPDENWARVYKARLPREDAPFTPPPPAPPAR